MASHHNNKSNHSLSNKPQKDSKKEDQPEKETGQSEESNKSESGLSEKQGRDKEIEDKNIFSDVKYVGKKIFTIIRNKNLIPSLLYFTGILLYLEIVFHLMIYRSLDTKIIYPILFALPVAALFTLITGFFQTRINKLLMWLVTVAGCLLYGLQYIYYAVFKVFFSFQSMGMAGDAFQEFGSDIATAIRTNLFGLILLMLPLLLLPYCIHKFFDCNRRTLKAQGILFAGAAGMQLIALLTLFFYGKENYTPYDLYYNTKVPELCGKQLGVVTLTRFDVAKLIHGGEKLVLADTDAISRNAEMDVNPTSEPKPSKEDKPETTGSNSSVPKELNATPSPSPTPTPVSIDRSPNIMDIDFDTLIDKEKDETIRTLHQYFASAAPTNKNEYTGMFQGYNLIMITAEGFSPYAVHEELTPTLYQLTHEGFIFNNFYTALWQTSTSDGEYAAMSGLIPVGTRSMYHSRNNLMPFVLGKQFNKLGIESKAYHNHTYTYYQRNETHPNLGYIFKAKGNGLELESDVWPGSDLEMINHTVDEYVDEEPFHVYYLTVSGHMNYTFTGNSMAYKNREYVKDLPYSDEAKAYIACQMELDRALEELIRRLTEAGVADKTVIALSADHYPYGWEKEKLDELAGHTVDPSFEVYRNHFILWNSAMKENIIVDEPASSLDILPTLSNLFGLEYDSRLLMGQDIFSDAEPLVILNNRSFITDKVRYNSETGEVTYLTEEELPKDYIKNLNNVIQNKFSVSQSIIKKDYYRHVFPEDTVKK